MRTVKELSELTGISVRTLHYYDEIGLLIPTAKTEAGYRLYDDKALETLQQILFFREFDIPLKEIKSVMENPALDRTRILQMQRKMLVAKKERMERLIVGIDEILKGENRMDFTIFNKTEIEEMFQEMFDRMPENLRQTAIEEFGSETQWREHYIKVLSSEKMQKNLAKVVEWYGGKDAYLSAAKNPISKEVAESYEKRIEVVLQKLSEKRSCPVDSFAVKEIVGEYAFVMKQFSQIQEEREWMLVIARSYRNEHARSVLDQKYGEGMAAFFADAIEAFYEKS
ncbi:MAG: MerR family transcriptional regulator [Lachnospiraceae bacterium]|nr:MerR family transcriptional regulator [Lachnospiraceae bacterium]